MQCKTCGYEPTMAEIQSGGPCPECERIAAQRAALAQRPVAPKVNPAVQKAMSGYEGAQPVVVVDLQMSFNSMVWFMVKWVLASIPAFIILFFILLALVTFTGGFLSGLSK